MKHTVVITKPPVLSGNHPIPDGAICGNGDLAAVLGSSGSGVRVFLGKSDLWVADPEAGAGGIRPLGYVDIDVPPEIYNVYVAEQRMDTAEVAGIFRDGYNYMEADITVPAGQNIVLLQLFWSKNFRCPDVRLTLSETDGCLVTPFSDGDVAGARSDFGYENGEFAVSAVTGIRKLAEDETCATYAIAVTTSTDGADYRSAGIERLKIADTAVVAKLKAENNAYWENFYAASSVQISDETLENDWYASLYLLAVTRGRAMFPAGPYGNLITTDSVPHGGAYALGFGYEAPYYSAVASNHPELTDYYTDPLFAAMESGRQNADSYLGAAGIYYPAYLGPNGYAPQLDTVSPEHAFMGQKIYASYAAVIPVLRLNKTLDADYARALYPYLKALADFWSSYLREEKGRYVIANDAVSPVPYDDPKFKAKNYKKAFMTKNSARSLGAVRLVFSALKTVATLVPEAQDEIARCNDVLGALSPYPVRGGKYAAARKGEKKVKHGAADLEHFYPMEQVGTDKKSVKTVRKTVKKGKRWQDATGTPVAYPAAVRAGLPAAEILKEYGKNKEKFGLPNSLYDHAGGSLETVGLAASMLNEMMLRSDGGVLRVFPNWAPDIDCAFRGLRADGAFLVDAKIENNVVKFVAVTSEKGAVLTILNPFTNKYYGGCKVTVGEETAVCDGELIEIDLAAGQTAYITSVNDDVTGLSRKAIKSIKKTAKKSAKKEKKAVKKAKRQTKRDEKNAIFFAKLEVKTDKKQMKKDAKHDKKENKKYAAFDRKTAKKHAKRVKKAAKRK
ncbi:MAG: hypothetical protein IJ766_01540 [Clostridia bacterium]|nr:hypothetical protein [Clostridia bacterium]